MGKLLKKEIGITLISLVVTIIILLILAGITINLVLADGGIFEKAEKASEEHEKGAAREKLELKLADMVIEKNTKKEYNQDDYLTEQLENSGFDVDEENVNLVTIDGWKFEIDRSVLKIMQNIGDTVTEDSEEYNKSLIGEVSKINEEGIKNIEVNGVTYSANVIIKQGNLLLDGSETEDATVTQIQEVIDEQTVTKSIYEFGNKETDVATETEDAKNMVILKVNGNITINENVTLTACKSDDGYGGPKGLFIYCTGTITNNGTISMTARGAKAEGKDVYLWQNTDGSYEYVPAVGANGGDSYTSSAKSVRVTGKIGYDGTDRKTGGGGSGGALHGDSGGYGRVLRGGNGTSYSGGTGSGAINENSKTEGTGGRLASDNGGMRRNWTSMER